MGAQQRGSESVDDATGGLTSERVTVDAQVAACKNNAVSARASAVPALNHKLSVLCAGVEPDPEGPLVPVTGSPGHVRTALCGSSGSDVRRDRIVSMTQPTRTPVMGSTV